MIDNNPLNDSLYYNYVRHATCNIIRITFPPLRLTALQIERYTVRRPPASKDIKICNKAGHFGDLDGIKKV